MEPRATAMRFSNRVTISKWYARLWIQSRHRLCASSSAKRGGRSGWLSGFAKSAFLVLLQVIHVEVAVRLEPVLLRLHRQGPHQPAAGGRIEPRRVLRRLIGLDSIRPPA